MNPLNVSRLILFVVAAILASLTSCTMPVPGGQMVLGNGGPQGPQYAGPDYGPTRRGPPPQQGFVGENSHRPDAWGEKITSTQKYLTKETRGAEIRIQGDASNEVCLKVREVVGHWCERIHSEHGTWPTQSEAIEQARKEFARLGFNLKPTTVMNQPKSFMITGYDLHEPVIGERQPSGDPVVTRTEVSESDVPPSILARSRKGETGILRVEQQEP